MPLLTTSFLLANAALTGAERVTQQEDLPPEEPPEERWRLCAFKV